MIGSLYNNLGISSLGIVFTLRHICPLSITKSLLIMPIITHKDLLQHLSRKTTNVHSLEQVLVSHQRCFSNFNARFYDSIVTSINAIQFLAEVGMIEVGGNEIVAIETLDYDMSMGKRAKKIFDAAPNMAGIINSDLSSLYTNLRIQI